MELVRLVAPIAEREALLSISGTATVVFRCRDADSAIVLASMSGRLRDNVGLWLEVNGEYSAQIAARDVKTLARLTSLRHVVIESSSALAHAEVVRAMLSDDEINFRNDVATIHAAYNRPSPPHPVTVWSYDDSRLASESDVLEAGRHEVVSDLDVTYFS